MNGEVSQILAIIGYGNGFLLRGDNLEKFSENQNFRYCKDFRFVRRHKRLVLPPMEEVVANNVVDWLQHLKKAGCTSLRLRYTVNHQDTLPSHIASAFVGGGGFYIVECLFNSGFEQWISRTKIGDKTDPDNRIWNVTFYLIQKGRGNIHYDFVEVNKQKNVLRDLLLRVEHFARNNYAENFAEIFKKALIVLKSDNLEDSKLLTELVPTDLYSLDSQQLLLAACTSWVFGGMGSWNDLGYDNKEIEEEYHALSKELYSTINDSLECAINSYGSRPHIV